MNSVLLISCKDQVGIVNAVTGKILKVEGNILDLEQHVEKESKMFFMRVEWKEKSMIGFDDLIEKFQMKLEYFPASEAKPKAIIMASQYDHCLIDTLLRAESEQLPMKVVAVVSNLTDQKKVADRFGISYEYFPIDKENQKGLEEKMIRLFKKLDVSLVVLARYMKVLGKEFINAFESKIINVHHSFLPAFAGSKPYHKAFEKGVKIIGATSHYATEMLDDGPIIEQSVRTTGHHFSVKDLIEIGSEIEKEVLFFALKKHLEHKIIIHKKRTIIFR